MAPDPTLPLVDFTDPGKGVQFQSNYTTPDPSALSQDVIERKHVALFHQYPLVFSWFQARINNDVFSPDHLCADTMFCTADVQKLHKPQHPGGILSYDLENRLIFSELIFCRIFPPFVKIRLN